MEVEMNQNARRKKNNNNKKTKIKIFKRNEIDVS